MIARAAAVRRTDRGKRVRRAAPAALTRERIVAAALALIDRRGVAGFSLRDVARRLGVFPTAIYWHVPGRNALLAEVTAFALRGIVPDTDPADWRGWLRTLFRGYRSAVRRHPNLAPLIGAQLVSNDGVDAHMIEGILAALTRAGYGRAGGTDLVEAYNVVIATMCGFVTMEFAPLPAEDPRRWANALRQRVREIGTPDHPILEQQLPALANRAFILRWQNGTRAPLDDSFEAFIDCAIRGLAERVAAGAGRSASVDG